MLAETHARGIQFVWSRWKGTKGPCHLSLSLTEVDAKENRSLTLSIPLERERERAVGGKGKRDRWIEREGLSFFPPLSWRERADDTMERRD